MEVCGGNAVAVAVAVTVGIAMPALIFLQRLLQ
jgi:hypothetical protein